MDGDRAIPILDRQPPLPKIAPMRIVNHDKMYNDERALVPITSYRSRSINLHTGRRIVRSWSRTYGDLSGWSV